ncbi:MAG: sigma-70 family RNA polymerase sigma factor [Peptococcaceae bacterium]|nr:sigma-70 family RNA polymerase sigma factor [Peptococcaceae bacterium]
MDQTTNGQDQIQLLLKRLQQGDETAREELVRRYQNFIAGLARKYSRDPDVSQSDAYSVALIAFNEAMDKYCPTKGTSFSGFARQVVSRRLIDHFRSNTRYKPETPIEEIPEIAVQHAEDVLIAAELAEEISWFERMLKEYKVTLEDLVRETPKHKDTRCTAIAMARKIAENPVLLAHFRSQKTLPFKALLKEFLCNPKTVQRHRKYIIAVCIALTGSSTYLKDYVLRVAEGCDDLDS